MMRGTAKVLLLAAFWSLPATPVWANGLIEAVSRNDIGAIANALHDNADPNQKYGGTTALHIAAEWGFTGIAQLLLKSGAKSDAIDNYQRTPLIWATLNSHPDVARLLVAARGDLNWRDEEGNSALSGAAASGDRPLVKLLIDSGARVARDDGIALRKAIDVGDADIVRVLIEIGADPCFHPGNDITKFTAAGEGKSLPVVKILATAAANCSETKTLLGDMMTAAAKSDRLEFVEYLLPLLDTARDRKSEQEENSRDPTAQALAAAVKANSFEVAKFLLEKATDLSPQKKGEVLVLALEGKHPAMFHLLLDHSPALEQRDDRGMSALIQCASDGDLENAKLLLEHGATLKASATHSTTPLLAACSAGHVALVDLLLQHGATCREIGESKLNPLLTAAMRGRTQVCRLLLQHGCDPNVTDPESGFTALHFAASHGDTETVQMLLLARTNSALKDKSGRTARDVAEENGAVEIVELLSAKNAPTSRRSSH